MRTAFLAIAILLIAPRTYGALASLTEPTTNPQNWMKWTFNITPAPGAISVQSITSSGGNPWMTLSGNEAWFSKTGTGTEGGRVRVAIAGREVWFYPDLNVNLKSFSYHSEISAGLSAATFNMSNVPASKPPVFDPPPSWDGAWWRDATITAAGGYSRSVKLLLQPEPSSALLSGVAMLGLVGLSRSGRDRRQISSGSV